MPAGSRLVSTLFVPGGPKSVEMSLDAADRSVCATAKAKPLRGTVSTSSCNALFTQNPPNGRVNWLRYEIYSSLSRVGKLYSLRHETVMSFEIGCGLWYPAFKIAISTNLWPVV